jgi:hypothetical protein
MMRRRRITMIDTARRERILAASRACRQQAIGLKSHVVHAGTINEIDEVVVYLDEVDQFFLRDVGDSDADEEIRLTNAEYRLHQAEQKLDGVKKSVGAYGPGVQYRRE